jgi:alcohol dehydrogenase class IV
MQLRSSFRYLAPATRLYAGSGALPHLASEARRVGAKRAFIIASNTLSRTSDLVERVKETLGDLWAGTFDGAKKESPVRAVMAGVEAVRAAEPDLIVAVGGGSAVVTARAITIIVGEGKSIEEMYTKHFPDRPPLVYWAEKPKIPNILVLTTPTTAADRGGAAVYDERPPHRKELYDPKTRPLAIIADPDALLTAPLPLYLGTSLTTFTGAIGALQAPELTPLEYADYRQALELSLTYLPQLAARPNDGDVRVHLFLAAFLLNRASQSTYNLTRRARTTGLERQVRYRYPQLDQGTVGAAMLATTMRLNQDLLAREQAQLAELLGVRRPGMTDRDAAEAAAQFVEGFLKSLGVPTRLRELGVRREDFRTLAEMDVREPAFGQGPNRVSDVEELVRILEMAW